MMEEEEESPSPLFLAADAGDVEEVQRLIAAGANVTYDDETGGETALHAAVKAGHKQVVKLLLNAGHSVNTYCDEHYTPLHLAADRDYVDVVEELLRRGAGVNAEDSGDCTPLHYAAEKGFRSIAEVLLNHGASVNSRCHGMFTPLHFAVSREKIDLVTLLLEAGADTKSVNRMRQTPLHLAALSGWVDIAKELLKHGADVAATDFEGRTPLHFACEFGNADMTALLLEAGSDVNAVSQEYGTAIEYATRSGDARCIEALENHCAMLRGADLHVSSPHLGDGAAVDFRCRCKAEVQKMKATKVNGVSASLYDVFVSDVDRAASLLRNDALRSLAAQDMTQLFPIYSSMIVRAVKKATKRLSLMDDAIEALEGLTHSRLPTEIIREVTKFLHDEDLNGVIVAYRGLDLCDRKK